jgi:hypothetical protein
VRAARAFVPHKGEEDTPALVVAPQANARRMFAYPLGADRPEARLLERLERIRGRGDRIGDDLGLNRRARIAGFALGGGWPPRSCSGSSGYRGGFRSNGKHHAVEDRYVSTTIRWVSCRAPGDSRPRPPRGAEISRSATLMPRGRAARPVANRTWSAYHCSMDRGAVIRGRLHGRVIELDEPIDDVEEGEVEVQVRSIQSSTPRPPDLLEVIASLPAGNRTKADIDQQLVDERSGWSGRG